MKTENKTPKIFYVILISIPILFLLLLEVGLQTFDYGKDISTWSKIDEDMYILNPDVGFRYFYNVKNVPNSIQDAFYINKKENTYRVFVLGGSSAAGYPYLPLGSFSRYIKRRLELFYPQKTIEVINLSLTAVNSYTIRDLMPEVIEQEPDLILIYAGHNEYYGALGIGSMESMGTSRGVVNFLLSLNKFKTTQLVRNIVKSVATFVSGDKGPQIGTLMSRMAVEQSIEFESDIFNAGVEQFKGNINDVIEMVSSKNIPLILSTVVSNLKDLKPFIPQDIGNGQTATTIYNKADSLFRAGNLPEANLMFRKAKDYDMLRFRATEKLNNVVRNYQTEQNIPVVDADSLVNKFSINNIVGNDLMVDHLHLNLRGYQYIGRVFYEKMIEKNYLPNQLVTSLNLEKQDSLTLTKFYFSTLDSIIAEYKIKLLKNDWPFTKPDNYVDESKLLNPSTYIDSVAFDFVTGKERWEIAERKIAAWYLIKNDYNSMMHQMDVLINQYPMIIDYYKFTANELLKVGKYNEAFRYINQHHKLQPNHFSSKWMGIINLSRKNYDAAVKYLEESVVFGGNDSQVYYNLAGAYAMKENYNKALSAIDNCLKYNSKFKGAIELKIQLETMLKK